MVTRQPWNSKHRNPSKLHRQRVANKKATTFGEKLVTSSLKLGGKAAKKLDKKVKRAAREKAEAAAPKPVETPKAVAAPVAVVAAAPVAAAAAAPTTASKKKKAAAKKVAAPADDAMDVEMAELPVGKPRLTEIRRGRKSKSKAAAMSDE